MKRSLSSRIAQCKQNLKSKLESLKARRQESFRLTPEEEAGWDAYLLEKDIEEAYAEEAFRSEICARCKHPRHSHFYEALECSSCYCVAFVNESEFTEPLRKQWEAFLIEEQEHDSQDDYYYQEDQDDWEDNDSEELDRIRREQSCAWGGDFTLHYTDPLIGPTSLTMFEGEWIWAFEEMRRREMMPKEAIDKLEQMFRKEQDQYHTDPWDDNDPLDDSDF